MAVGSEGISGQSIFRDDVWTIFDDADPTKKLQLQVSGLTTGTTRTLTIPDADGTIALTTGSAVELVTVADESSDTTCFPLFVTAATGDLGPKTNSALAFNSSTGAFTFGGSLTVTKAVSGSVFAHEVINTTNTASSDTRFAITAGGSSGGDPYLQLGINGVMGWQIGIDNSDSDKLVIATGGLGATRVAEITTAGAWDLQSGTLASGAITTSGDITYSGTTFNILSDSGDGSDDSKVAIGAGGAAGGSRGGYIELNGNEHANTGRIQIVSGNVSGGDVTIYAGSLVATFAQADQSATFAGTLSATTGTFTATGPTVDVSHASGYVVFSSGNDTHIGSASALFSGGSTNDLGISVTSGDAIWFGPAGGTADLIIETTDSSATFAGTLTATAGSGFGIAPTDGTLHVHTATAGSVTADTGGDDLVVENSDDCGIHLLSPDDKLTNIYFGSPTDSVGAKLQYKHDDNQLAVATSNVGHSLILQADDSVTNLTLAGASGNENATFVGDVTMGSTSESSAQTLTIKAADAQNAFISFASASDAVNALIINNDGANHLRVATAAVGHSLKLEGDDQVVNLTLAGASGSETATFAGKVLVGASTAAIGRELFVEGVGIEIVRRGTTASSAPLIDFVKSNHATANTLVDEHDDLGIIYFRGADGTDYLSIAAEIRGAVDGTPGTSDMPGRLEFLTSIDGADIPTLALTLDSSQNATFAGTLAAGATTITGQGTVSADFGVGTTDILNSIGGVISPGVTGAEIAGSAVSLALDGTSSADFYLADSGAAADNKVVDLSFDGGVFNLRGINDANGVEDTAFSYTISTGAIDFTDTTLTTTGAAALGDTTITGTIGVTDSQGADLPLITATNTSSASYTQGFHAIFPNIPAGPTTGGYIVGQDWSSKNAGRIGFVWNSTGSDSNALEFGFHSADGVLLLYPTGAATLAGALTLTGGQIKFPATQVPSADAHTLDDYEEATFTPAMEYGGTPATSYHNQYGRYTKIGNLVFFQIEIQVNVVGTTGDLTITIDDIGHTPSSSNKKAVTVFSDQLALVASGAVQAEINDANTYISLYEPAADGDTNGNELTHTTAPSPAQFAINGHYFV